MLSRLRDVWTMFRIAGYSDTVELWRHSKTLASSVRNHIVLDVLIALEKCGLLAGLGTLGQVDGEHGMAEDRTTRADGRARPSPRPAPV